MEASRASADTAHRLPAYSSRRPEPLHTESADESSSSDSSSMGSTIAGDRASRGPRAELKKAAERKFRHRYLLLQQAYEQRLQALATQVRHVVAELQSDSTIEYLQQDPLTHEYARARVDEIVLECFASEKEKYVKVVCDQIAWQTSDLHDAQRRIRALQKREKATQSKWKQAQSETRRLQQQLELRVHEIGEQQRDARRLEESVQRAEEERDDARVELEKTRAATTSLDALREEYEVFKVRVQNERDNLKLQMEQLRDECQNIENVRNGVERDNQHLRQLLSIAEAKNEELSNSLRHVQAEEYSTRLLRMEHELAQQRHTNESLEKENEQLKKKYEEFGVQVELYLEEQSRERATIVKQGEERERKLAEELAALRAHSVDAIKVKQNEMLRLADQVKFRQEALTKAEQKISVLEERIGSLESVLGEEKLRCAKTVSELEKEIAQLRATVDKEQQRVKDVEATHVQTKQAYEQKLASVQVALEQQHQHTLKERELEARTRWQNEFVAKQEARIETMKSKYDAALEAQQAELLRSRQVALDAAKSAADKVTEVKSLQQSQRVDEEDAKRRREKMREAERLRTEDERARESANRKLQKELEERDKQLRELERKLTEKERLDDRRRTKEDKAVKESKTDRSRVVVLNVSGADDLDEHEQKLSAEAIAMAKHHRRVAPSRQPSKVPENNQETHSHDECIPMAQHKAELQAREAQVALEAEKRVQKEMNDFQERKERELRNAMVNVRKGIQRLESSLDTEKSERKRVEEELFSERQQFVAMKSELDDICDAKKTLSQRLEESNGHLGRLRDVVKEAQQKVSVGADRLEAAIRDEVEAVQYAANLKAELEKLETTMTNLKHEMSTSEAELQSAQRTGEGLNVQLRGLQNELTLRDKQFEAAQQALSDFHENEMNRVSKELTARIQELQDQLAEQNGAAKQLQERVEGGAESMEQLAAERSTLERSLEAAKSELGKQRKEFSDLARMHKNLSDTMNSRIHDEQEKQAQLADELDAVQLSLKKSQLARQKALQLCLAHVKQLQGECTAIRNAAAAEVKAAWKHAKKEIQAHAIQIQMFVGNVFEKEKITWDNAVRLEREDWRSRVELKEQEMDSLLTGQKLDDHTKYMELADRLEAKAQQLKNAERQATAQLQRIGELQFTIKRLDDENQARLVEQTQLADQLSSSRVVSDREVEAKQQLELSVARVADVSQVFLGFVRQVMKEFALDPRKVLSVLDRDPTHADRWVPDELSRDLRHVLELLQERMTAKEMAAVDLAARPVQTELNAAREALAALIGSDQGDDVDDTVSKHLPWYVVVVRCVKHQMEHLRRDADQLREQIGGKSAEASDLQSLLTKLQESHATLTFEKDTFSHEMNLQLQTLQRRRESDLQLQNEEHERKLGQVQRRASTDHLKAKEEYELTINQLKMALEAEKKACSKLKQDMMMSKIENEKLQGEQVDRVSKIEKELESVRDELAKWKRKAKLSATKSPGTPSRRPSVMFSSPFPQTDDDMSDASFQSMFPVSRRPSSAMADLSNLMEQSLQDLRKENEGVVPPGQQPSPARLLQSPMRRVSATTRPSPLRIPMYPSPARKRSSLVPPPKLISTVSGLTPPLPPTVE